MKCNFRKAISVILAALMLISSVPLAGLTDIDLSVIGTLFASKAEAATSGYYTYTVLSGGAIITDVNESIRGNITIPSTLGGYPVTGIGEEAFIYCHSLTSVTIPDSVTSIGDYAFRYCSKLTCITVDFENTAYSSDEYGVLFNKDKTELIQYPIGNTRANYVIPDSVISIGVDAFFGCANLISVTISDSVTSIGGMAFYGCSSLTSVTIPDSVTSIDYSAFEHCNNLTNIKVDSANTVYSNDEYGVLFNKNKTELIQYPTGNTRISYTIPDSVTSIDDYAFFGYNSLTRVIIPDSLTSIGDNAFYGCCLTSVTIPRSVTSIGDNAFESCSGLTSVTIPDSVTRIGDRAFFYCESLTSITIPDSVTSIGGFAFDYCDRLTDVYYSGTEDEWKAITFGSYNEPLLNANIHYNYVNTEPAEETYEIYISYPNPANPEETIEFLVISDSALPGKTVEVLKEGEEQTADVAHTYEEILSKVTVNGMEPDYEKRPATVTIGENNKIVVEFKLVEYTATFNGNGGYIFDENGDEQTEIILKGYFGQPIEIPGDDALYREGYDFMGWDVEPSETFTENTVYNATWTAYIGEVIFIVVDKNGEEIDRIPVEFDYGEKIAAPDYNVPDGYEFSGWDISDDVMGTEELTYTATITPIGYELSYEITGLPADKNVEAPKAQSGLAAGEDAPVAMAPIVFGYTFNGWYHQVAVDKYDKYYGDGNDVINMPASDVVLTGKFTANEYTIIFNSNGEEIDSVKYYCDETVKILPTPTKEGSEFLGWYADGKKYESGFKMPANDLTLTAKWGEIESDYYTITYLDGEKVVCKAAYKENEAIADYSLPNAEGKTFNGWKPEVPKTMPAENLVVYAEWSTNKHEVIYDANGGLFTTEDGTTGFIKYSDVAYGESIPVPETTPVREGYTFIRWVPEAPEVMPDRDLTFKAEWKEIYKEETFTAYFYLSDDDYLDGNYWYKVDVISGQKIEFPDDPEIDGQEFICWDNDSIYMGDEDMHFVALTERIEYYIEFLDIYENPIDGADWFAYWGDVISEEDIPEPEEFDGYEFIGWFDENGKEYQFPVTVKSDMTFFAKYNEVHVHIPGEWIVTTEPTETTPGVETQYCTECNAVIATREIDALEHIHVPKTVTTPATCTVPGMKYDICKTCGEIIGEPTVLPVISHTAGSWVISIEPDCINEGEKVCHCTVCGTLVDSEIIAAKGHVPGEWKVVSESTAETEGLKIKKCSVCGITVEEEIIPKKTVVTDKNTGISIEINGDDYEGKVDIVVEESFDGAAFNLINTETDALQLFIYDITMTVDGKETQPAGELTVRIPLPEGYNPERSFVYHVNTETGKVEKMNSRYEDGYLVFKATHFSFYAVVEEGIFTAEIRNPSRTVINYGDSIVLHLDSNIELPENYTVEWIPSNDNFSYESDGVTCTITPEKSGDTDFTAVVYDANGNEVCKVEQTMTSKAGFFWKIIAFFKGIFRLNKTFSEAIKF